MAEPFIAQALALTAAGLAAAVAVLLARLRRLETAVAWLEDLVATTVAPRYRLLGRAVALLSASARSIRALERASRRPRRRYIAFYVVSEDGRAPDPKSLEEAIRASVRELAGLLGVAESNVSLVYYDPEKAAGIVRATNTTKYVVLAALGMTRRVNGKRVLIIPVRTAGTIKRAKKAIQQLG